MENHINQKHHSIIDRCIKDLYFEAWRTWKVPLMTDLYRLYNTNIHEKIAQGLMGEGKTSVNADQQMNVENQSKSWLIRG